MELILKTLNLLPGSIQRIPYYLGFHITKLLVQTSESKIWYRNSLYFKRISIGVSDIDFTFFYHKAPSIKYIQNVLKKLSLIKNFIPIIGEVNIYSKTELKTFYSLFNPHEIERDPLLIDTLQLFPREHTQATKISYLIRMLIADRHNITSDLTARRNKWTYTLEKLNINSRYFENNKNHSLSTFIDFLNKEIINNDDFCVFLKLFLKVDIYNDKTINDFYSNLDSTKKFMILAPARWIGASFANNNFEEDLKLLPTLTKLEEEVLLENIKWEICGLYSQVRLIQDHNNLKQHLSNLKRVLIPLVSPNKDEVMEGLTNLLQLHSSLLENQQ